MKNYLIVLFLLISANGYCDFGSSDANNLNAIASDASFIKDATVSADATLKSIEQEARNGLLTSGATPWLSQVYDMLHHSSDTEYGDMSWLQVIKEENSLWRQEHVQPFFYGWRNFLNNMTNKWWKVPTTQYIPPTNFPVSPWDNLRVPSRNSSGVNNTWQTIRSSWSSSDNFFTTLLYALGRVERYGGATGLWLWKHYDVNTNFHDNVIKKYNSWDSFYNIYTNADLSTFLADPQKIASFQYVRPTYLWTYDSNSPTSYFYPSGFRRNILGLQDLLFDWFPTVLGTIDAALIRIYQDFLPKFDEISNSLNIIAEKDFIITNILSLVITNNSPVVNLAFTNELMAIQRSTTNLVEQFLYHSTNNFSFFVGQFSYENPLSNFEPSSDVTYYQYLTNYYLRTVKGQLAAEEPNATNWFGRVETLLAAIVFSQNDSSTNTVNASAGDTAQGQVNSSLNQLNSDASTVAQSTKQSAKNVVKVFGDYCTIFDRSTLPSEIVVAKLSNETFISIHLSENPLFQMFIDAARATTTFCWSAFGIFCLYRFLVWSCRAIYCAILLAYRAISSFIKAF